MARHAAQIGVYRFTGCTLDQVKMRVSVHVTERECAAEAVVRSTRTRQDALTLPGHAVRPPEKHADGTRTAATRRLSDRGNSAVVESIAVEIAGSHSGPEPRSQDVPSTRPRRPDELCRAAVGQAARRAV